MAGHKRASSRIETEQDQIDGADEYKQVGQQCRDGLDRAGKGKCNGKAEYCSHCSVQEGSGGHSRTWKGRTEGRRARQDKAGQGREGQSIVKQCRNR